MVLGVLMWLVPERPSDALRFHTAVIVMVTMSTTTKMKRQRLLPLLLTLVLDLVPLTVHNRCCKERTQC